MAKKRAGLVLYKIGPKTGKLYFYCMIPSDPFYGGSSPQIPKGQIDPGMDEESTAIKEAVEEIGLKVENLKTFEFFKKYNKMYIFIGTVKNSVDFDETCFETGWSGWVCYDDQRDRLRKEQLHIFDEIAKDIKK